MGSPYVGEIRLFAGTFAPVGWAFCDGSAQSIAEYSVLYNLIGTTYGGDGVNTFNLPNLQSRVPIHQGSAPFGSFVIGQSGGVETVTLNSTQVGSHSHALQAIAGGAASASPANAYPATTSSTQQGTALYGAGSGKPTTLSPQSVSSSAGGSPHSNLQPYLAVSYIISLFGIYPSQN
ncbi:MAG: phage tail protein [Pseudomonadota bacterium]|nr:phage tail protein [Pseudomonadota bacterium]